MKSLKKTLLILALISPIILQAQSEKEINKNEIGTDITSLIEQILNFNQDQFSTSFSPIYQLIYKRHFNKFSLRMAIGGNSFSRERDSQVTDEKVNNSAQSFNYRIGLEKQMNIGKHWRFSYGLDFNQVISNSSNDFIFQNGGWRHGSERKRNTIGFSPFFGIDFKINERISLQTETNFIVYSFKSSTQPIITQILDNPVSPMPSTEKEIENQKGTEFNVPNFLNLTIRF